MPRPDYRSAPVLLHLLGLAVLAGVLTVGTCIVFAPGGMNPDTRWQLHQVLGNEPLSDWHPAIMTITWRWLTVLTGHASAIMYAQIALIFAAGFGFAVYLFDVTRSKAWSVVGVLFIMAPPLFTFLGVIWKDTQMAGMFFLAVVCVLLSFRFPRLRWPLLIIALLAIGYGTAVRKNAFFAVLPLIYLLYRGVFAGRLGRIGLPGDAAEARQLDAHRAHTSRTGRMLRFGAVTAAVLAFVIGSGAVLDARYRPLETHQVSQVMLDDVIFSVPKDELRHADIDPQLREKLLAAQTVCAEKEAYEDAYWRCYGRGKDGIYTAIEHVDELREAWLKLVPTRPDRYLLYRVQTFTHFLFDNYTDWDGATVENSLGFHTKFAQANDAGKTYVEKFGVRDLPWLFTGWFWLVSPLVLLAARGPIKGLELAVGWPGLRAVVMNLSLSSVIYIVGYFPIVPANHFRYVYWPVFAVSMSAIMLAAAGVLAWRARRRPEAVGEPAGASGTEAGEDEQRTTGS
nr:hypothetical protein GCM10023233_06340 [Brevibacterium otitidis]